jgi:hypothetical protein
MRLARLAAAIGAAAAAALAGACTRADDAAAPPPAPAPAVAGAETAGLPPAVSLAPLARLLQAAQGDGRVPFAAPTAEEAGAFSGIAEEIARAAMGPGPATATAGLLGLPAGFAPVAAWNAAAQRLGFEVVVARDRETFALIRELDGIRRGGGVYVVRPGPWRAAGEARPVVFQAPHSFYDAGSGAIARELFERTGAIALALNTAHRYGGKPAPPKGTPTPADCAHAEATYFQAFTTGTSRALPRAVYIQIHGFAPEGHPDLRTVEIVASKGDASGVADPLFDALVARLRAVLGASAVAVYGREARTLGATENVQGRFLNAYSDDLFYHLELSRNLRARFEVDAALRARIVDALRPLAGEPP